MAGEAELPVRRRDQELDFHDVLPENCPHCGCQFVYAKDDPGIVWDPGRAWAEECSNHDCHCHDEPVIGRRRDEEPVNPL